MVVVVTGTVVDVEVVELDVVVDVSAETEGVDHQLRANTTRATLAATPSRVGTILGPVPGEAAMTGTIQLVGVHTRAASLARRFRVP